VPGLGDLPLLGRLFSNNSDQLQKTEIVLMITPRIIRNIERPELADSEFFGGTESTASDQALQLRTTPMVRSRPALRPSAAGTPGAPVAGPEALPPSAPVEPEELPAEPDPVLPPGTEPEVEPQPPQPGAEPAEQ